MIRGKKQSIRFHAEFKRLSYWGHRECCITNSILIYHPVGKPSERREFDLTLHRCVFDQKELLASLWNKNSPGKSPALSIKFEKRHDLETVKAHYHQLADPLKRSSLSLASGFPYRTQKRKSSVSHKTPEDFVFVQTESIRLAATGSLSKAFTYLNQYTLKATLFAILLLAMLIASQSTISTFLILNLPKLVLTLTVCTFGLLLFSKYRPSFFLETRYVLPRSSEASKIAFTFQSSYFRTQMNKEGLDKCSISDTINSISFVSDNWKFSFEINNSICCSRYQGTEILKFYRLISEAHFLCLGEISDNFELSRPEIILERAEQYSDKKDASSEFQDNVSDVQTPFVNERTSNSEPNGVHSITQRISFERNSDISENATIERHSEITRIETGDSTLDEEFQFKVDEFWRMINGNNWEDESSGHGYKIWKRQDPVFVERKTVIKVKMDIQKFLEVMKDPDNMKILNPYIKNTRLVKRISDDRALIRVEVKCPFPFSDRDFLHFVCKRETENSATILTYSAPDEVEPPTSKFVRGWTQLSGWHAEKDGEHINITFYTKSDAKLSVLPKSLIEMGSKSVGKIPVLLRDKFAT